MLISILNNIFHLTLVSFSYLALNKHTAIIHGEAKSCETESDEESDIDDNVSLIECARIHRRLSSSPAKGKLKNSSSLESCSTKLTDADADFPIVISSTDKYKINRNVTEIARNKFASSDHLPERFKSSSTLETCNKQLTDDDADFPIVISSTDKYKINRNVTEIVRNKFASSDHLPERCKSSSSLETCNKQLTDDDPDFPIVMSRAEKYGMNRNVTEAVRNELVLNNHLSVLDDRQSARDSDHSQNSAEVSS